MPDKIVTFKVSQEMYDHLIRSTHEKSLRDQRNYCLSDMIRMSLEQSYPMEELNVLPERGSGKCKKNK